MPTEEVLEIVLRETTAIGKGWRMDWNGFDGRELRDQLNGIEDWAKRALASTDVTYPEYVDGSKFLKDQCAL